VGGGVARVEDRGVSSHVEAAQIENQPQKEAGGRGKGRDAEQIIKGGGTNQGIMDIDMINTEE